MRNLALAAGLIAIGAAGAIACGSSFNGTDQAVADGGTDDAPSSTHDDGGSGDPLMNVGNEGGAFKDAGPGGGTRPDSEGGAPLSGIFVSTSLGHDDTGDGSMANPYLTLKKAIGLAASLKKVVVACNETYAENLDVVDGVSIFANYDCTKGWVASPKNGVLMAPTSPAVLTDPAKPVVTGTTIGNLDIVAPLSAGGDRSSIGIVAINSHGLELSNLLITTQNAAPGADQVEPTALVNDATVDAVNGTAGTNTCGGSGKPGGTGGPGSSYKDACVNITAVNPKHTITKTSVTATQGNYVVANAGTNGASAAAGSFSSDKNTGFYLPGNGTAGVNGNGGTGANGLVATNLDTIDDIDNGKVGANTIWSCQCGPVVYAGSCVQGGTSATSTSLTSGSGGGAGGCPGLAGLPGTGGGASIGVLMFGEPLTLTTVSYTIGNGGNGGKGTQGSSPTNGGAGGLGGTPGTAAGYSGSGAGGPCVAVAYDGTSGPPITNKGGAAPGVTMLGSAGKGVAGFGTVPASGDGAKSDLYKIP